MVELAGRTIFVGASRRRGVTWGLGHFPLAVRLSTASSQLIVIIIGVRDEPAVGV